MEAPRLLGFPLMIRINLEYVYGLHECLVPLAGLKQEREGRP